MTPADPPRPLLDPTGTPTPSCPGGLSTRAVVIIAAAALLLTLAIHFDMFFLPLQLLLRDWGLHWSALLSTSLCLGLMLQATSQHSSARAILRLATWVPFGLLAVHELGQWLWPDRGRDHFDSVRDVSLNLLGSWLGWSVLASWLASVRPDVPARRRRRDTAAGR